MPETWDEYLDQVAFFTRDTDDDGQNDFFGVVNQGLRPDPIAMEWSNYLFANGGRFHDEDWTPMLDSPEAIEAVEDYTRNLQEYGPLGAASFGFDEAFNVAAQGRAYSYITYNMFRPAYDDPSQSAVVGDMEIAAGAQWRAQRRLGLGHPQLLARSGCRLDLPRVGREPGDRQEARPARRLADPRRRLRGPGGAGEVPLLSGARELLATSHNFPVFTYTPQFVEVLGRELSLAVTGEKTAEEAMQTANAELADLLREDGKLE